MFVFVWGYVHCVPMEDRDPWELELQAVLSCPMWESNSGPLEKQDMLLITEPVCHHLKLSWEHLIIKCWFFFSYLRKILSYLWYYTREKISNVELVRADMGWDTCFPYKGDLPGMEWKEFFSKEFTLLRKTVPWAHDKGLYIICALIISHLNVLDRAAHPRT